MEKLKIKVILGSTREGRFGDKPANVVFDIIKNKNNIEAELLDLRDYEMPLYKESISPSYVSGDYTDSVVNSFAKKIKEADGFIIVSPEYNHSFSAVLKNAMDNIYKEWNNKPVSFVSYGSVGGGRAVEQLRLVSIELQMTPIRNAVHIFSPWNLTEKDGSLKLGALDSYNDSMEKMVEQLIWWAEVLKKGRGR